MSTLNKEMWGFFSKCGKMEGLKGLLGFLTGRIEDVWLYVTTPKQTNAPYVSEIHWSKSNSKEHYTRHSI